jgi:hypothetical protein
MDWVSKIGLVLGSIDHGYERSDLITSGGIFGHGRNYYRE